jgi:hypothetical protein
LRRAKATEQSRRHVAEKVWIASLRLAMTNLSGFAA